MESPLASVQVHDWVIEEHAQESPRSAMALTQHFVLLRGAVLALGKPNRQGILSQHVPFGEALEDTFRSLRDLARPGEVIVRIPFELPWMNWPVILLKLATDEASLLATLEQERAIYLENPSLPTMRSFGRYDHITNPVYGFRERLHWPQCPKIQSYGDPAKP